MELYDIIPDCNALLSLEPEEIGGIILEYLNSLPEGEPNQFNRYNFTLPHTVSKYPPQKHDEILQALMEGWIWLEREGLLAPKPSTQGGWVFITRRGKKLKNREGLATYKRTDLLPKEFLHPQIAQKVWSAFIRGEYDTAVFQAFKEVEVAVRTKAGLSADLLGVKVMRTAFSSEDGSLSDMTVEKGEREAIQNLFAGAIGTYKNPHSHRDCALTDPIEAVEIIMLASHLLKIVDSRVLNTV